MEPRTIVVLGKSGSGKDTQLQLLSQKLSPVKIISTGDISRSLAAKETLLGKRIRETLVEGGLLPAWLAAFMWQHELAQHFKGDEHLLLGSSPRRTEEAAELDDVILWLKRRPVEALLLDISDEEAVRRIVLRRRDDYDYEENVRARLRWFHRDVDPTITYYEKSGRLARIDGIGTVAEVFDRIKTALEIT